MCAVGQTSHSRARLLVLTAFVSLVAYGCSIEDSAVTATESSQPVIVGELLVDSICYVHLYGATTTISLIQKAKIPMAADGHRR